MGNKAKAMISSTDGIGSVYSPPDREGDESQPKGNSIAQMAFVETIPFVDFRSEVSLLLRNCVMLLITLGRVGWSTLIAVAFAGFS